MSFLFRLSFNFVGSCSAAAAARIHVVPDIIIVETKEEKETGLDDLSKISETQKHNDDVTRWLLSLWCPYSSTSRTLPLHGTVR